MAAQLQITVREMPHSDAVEAAIRRKAAGLERVHPRMTAIRATVQAPHHHHQHGSPYTVKLDITLPGGEIVVNRDHANDVHVALRDAFDAARRQLEDYVSCRDGGAKSHRAARTAPGKRRGIPSD